MWDPPQDRGWCIVINKQCNSVCCSHRCMTPPAHRASESACMSCEMLPQKSRVKPLVDHVSWCNTHWCWMGLVFCCAGQVSLKHQNTFILSWFFCITVSFKWKPYDFFFIISVLEWTFSTLSICLTVLAWRRAVFREAARRVCVTYQRTNEKTFLVCSAASDITTHT